MHPYEQHFKQHAGAAFDSVPRRRMVVMDESLAPAEAKGKRIGHIFCLQLGSKAARTVNDEDADKGHAFFDILAMADLQGLTVKDTVADDAEAPVNGKRSRIEHMSNQVAKLPRGFVHDSVHERRALEYLDAAHAKFTELYRHRRPLYLTPRNDCGVRKFVCTTVRFCRSRTGSACSALCCLLWKDC